MQYDNTNSGVLFRNEKKQSEKHPDLNGSINSDGRDYWLSAWVNESKDGKKYFKLSLTPKDEQRQPAPRQQPAQQESFEDEDLPF